MNILLGACLVSLICSSHAHAAPVVLMHVQPCSLNHAVAVGLRKNHRIVGALIGTSFGACDAGVTATLSYAIDTTFQVSGAAFGSCMQR